jgi:hypothetical protein
MRKALVGAFFLGFLVLGMHATSRKRTRHAKAADPRGVKQDADVSIKGKDQQLNSLVCKVILLDIVYEPYIVSHSTNGEVFFACHPVRADGKVIGLLYTLDLPKTLLEPHREQIVKGGDLFISIPGGGLASDSVIIPDVDTVVLVEAPANLQSGRSLNSRTTGTLELIIIRIIAKDASPNFSADELRGYIFENDISVKHQYSLCSWGKLNFEPVQGGIMEVEIDIAAQGQSYMTIMNAGETRANEVVGRTVREMVDHIMFVIPPGTGSWAAFAAVSGKQVRLATLFMLFLSDSMYLRMAYCLFGLHI